MHVWLEIVLVPLQPASVASDFCPCTREPGNVAIHVLVTRVYNMDTHLQYGISTLCLTYQDIADDDSISPH